MFSFAIGNIPVRVHRQFLFLALFLGLMGGSDVRLMVTWVAIVFVSVILHELGHALVGKAFGLTPEIDLHGMGGTTSWANWAHKKVSRGPRILISLAGPGIGILIGACVWFAPPFLGPLSPFARGALGQIVWVNFGWGVLNLLPMLPLDGGNVMRQVLEIITGGRGERPARIVSIAVGGAAGLAVVFFWGIQSSLYSLLLLGMLISQNVRALRPIADAGSPPQQARW